MRLGALVRAALLSNELRDGGNTELRTDRNGALWARDYQSQPAQSSTPITPAALDHGLTFRALRFNVSGGGSGTVTVDLIKADGNRDSGVTQDVSNGEVWSISSAACPRISAVGAGVTVRALG